MAVNILYIVVDMSGMKSSIVVQDKNIMPAHTDDQCLTTPVTTISGNDHKTREYQDALSDGDDGLGTSLMPKTAGGASPADPPVSMTLYDCTTTTTTADATTWPTTSSTSSATSSSHKVPYHLPILQHEEACIEDKDILRCVQ